MVMQPESKLMSAGSCPSDGTRRSGNAGTHVRPAWRETRGNRTLPGILTPLLLSLLAACGGSGGGGEAPVADAAAPRPNPAQLSTAQESLPLAGSLTPPADLWSMADNSRSGSTTPPSGTSMTGTPTSQADRIDASILQDNLGHALINLGTLAPDQFPVSAVTGSTTGLAGTADHLPAVVSALAGTTASGPGSAISDPPARLSAPECALTYHEKTLQTVSAVDKRLTQQWYIENTGYFTSARSGIDLNVKPVWNSGLKGQGIRVAVIDDAIELTHDDLLPNVLPGASYNYMPEAGGSLWPLPCRTSENHGTQVAGIIAARDGNGIGIAGVASRASLVGLNALSFARDGATLKALAHETHLNHIYNNSWGAPDLGHFYAAGPSEEAFRSLIRKQVDTGRNGLGTIFVFAGGNGGARGDYAIYDGYMSTLGTLSVCAVNASGYRAIYSEPGASLLVCAPSGDSGSRGSQLPKVSTTTINNTWSDTFNGTSAAAPMASGVIALMLQANPKLSWRDVRLVLALTARKVDEHSPGWTRHGNLNFHHEYGFGLIDAQAAVQRARSWTSVGGSESLRSCGPYTVSLPANAQTIPEVEPLSDDAFAHPFDYIDLNRPVPGGLVSKIRVPAECGLRHIEHLDVRVRASRVYGVPGVGYNGYGDLQISLTSPAGQTSTLATPHQCWQNGSGSQRTETACTGLENFRFGVTRHLEEPVISAGNNEWTLTVADRRPGTQSALSSWEISFHGR